MKPQAIHASNQSSTQDPPACPEPQAPVISVSQRLTQLGQSKALPRLSMIAITLLASNPVIDGFQACYGGGHHG